MKSRVAAETTISVSSIMDAARLQQVEMLALLRHLVETESPSHDKAAVDACVKLTETACRELGGAVRLHRQKGFGDLLEARFGQGLKRGDAHARSLLLLGHLDTVWPIGTLRKMPFRKSAGRVWGPGVLDMKAGVAMALSALAIVQERGPFPRSVILLLNSDEEVGSPVSRSLTERLARDCEAVFVLEPSQGLGGAYKTARKGTGDFTVKVTGVAAHAGVDFSNGHSAVLELARQIDRIAGFTDLDSGITVNPGVIVGGTQANVVAEKALVHVDFRFAQGSQAKLLERKFRSLRPFDKHCRLEVAGGVNRPPMERTKATVELFAQAETLAVELGFELKEASTGGGSDGNFTSAIGVPTLDGMGAVGEGAHAVNESILIDHLAPRTALLAAMIMKV